MGRNRSLALFALLAAAPLTSGCGAMLQAGYGFSEEETRTVSRTRKVRFEGLPPGATVVRRDGDHDVRVADPRFDIMEYQVEETVAVPRSRWPMYLGTALDAAAFAGAVVLARRTEEDARFWSSYTAYYLGAATIADAVFSVVYSLDQTPKPVQHRAVEAPPVTWVARVGEESRQVSLQLAWADRARFDFDTPQEAEAPGGPRVGALAPPAPPVREAPVVEASTPPPRPEERWYGWQFVALDALAITGFALALKNDDTTLRWASVGLFVGGPPAVHLFNQQYARAGSSLLMRGLGPLVGGWLGGLIGLVFVTPFLDCDGGDLGICFPTEGLVYGAVIGASLVAAAAPILDAAALAWKPLEAEAAEPSQSGLTIVPSTGVTTEGKPTFGFAGRF